MKIWIRHVNGTVEDLGAATEAEAIERFSSHPWDEELADYEPEKDAADHCLPAFGIVDGEKASCDVTPFDEGACKVNLYFHRPGTFFGLFPMKKNVWEHLPDYPRSSFKAVANLFYARDISGLSKLIQDEKSSPK